MTRLSDGPFGPGKRKLAELSDAELAAERKRRRKSEEPDDRPSFQRVRQYLANLELDTVRTSPRVLEAFNRAKQPVAP